MGKFGKFLAPVVAVIAIVALVMSYLVAKQGKLFRQRAEILAEGLSSAAKVLAPGSEKAKSAAFEKGDNDKPESGPLGWPEFAKDSGAYEKSAQSVAALAQTVVKQRDAIISQLLLVSDKLETPEDSRPNEDALKGFDSYEEGLGSFVTYVETRIERDNAIVSKINDLASENFSLKGNFQGEITGTAELGEDDEAIFEKMGQRIESLKSNYKGYQDLVLKMSDRMASELGQFNIVLKKLDKNNVAFTNDGMSNENLNTYKQQRDVVLKAFEENLQQVKQELAKIGELQKVVAKRDAEIASLRQEMSALQAKLDADEEVIENYYRQGLGMSSVHHDRQPKANLSEVDKSLAGKVLQVDAKYGYLIIDLTKYDVVAGAKFSVHRNSNGNYLGEITLIDVEDYNSVARVLIGDIDDIEVGDIVVIGSSAIQ